MGDTQYTWIDFYMELADKLVVFNDDRQALISKVLRVFQAIGMKPPKLDADGVLHDIDPFTVFGLFNRGISDANRKRIVAGFASEFDIEASLPSDFEGIPRLNNLSATFYAFYDDPRRNAGDIDRLWATFLAALAYADNPDQKNRSVFSAAYDAILHQYSISWKITMALFYVRPYAFLSLDSRNCWFLTLPEAMPAEINEDVKSLKVVPNADSYLELCDRIRDAMEKGSYAYKTYPELSLRAFTVSEEVNQLKKEQRKERERAAQDAALGDVDVEMPHYWLYAPGEGASMWDDFYERGVMGLGWRELGDLSAYATKEDIRRTLRHARETETSQSNSALTLWQFVHDVKPGDVVFAKRGRSEIVGRGVVTSDYIYDPRNEQYPSIREVSWGSRGRWHIDEQLAMKTLTDVTDRSALVAKIEAFFDDGDKGLADATDSLVAYPHYSKESFLDEVFMDEASYDMLSGVLRSKKNIVLQGAPGVGKTFIAKRLAYSMMGVKDISRVMMIQFHQSYSYEDFIEGYRPNVNGFELSRGPFYDFCKDAADDEDNDYFFIIDEINRGNLSKIFGELFMLIENDKRGSRNKLQLLYSRELFCVPSNVYLIGMMNTADRSLAMLDYALRRRFAFFDLKPAFDSEGFREYQESLGSVRFDALVRVVEQLNKTIAEDETLGEGFCIGHSYLCGLDPEVENDTRLQAIVDYELVPMLKEYWFDEPGKVYEWTERLHGALR